MGLPKIASCVQCGGIDGHKIREWSLGVFGVVCGEKRFCCYGPVKTTKGNAIKAWNNMEKHK